MPLDISNPDWSPEEIAADEAAKSKLKNKESAKVKLKDFEFKGTTVAALKAELKAFADGIKEVLSE